MPDRRGGGLRLPDLSGIIQQSYYIRTENVFFALFASSQCIIQGYDALQTRETIRRHVQLGVE